MKNKYAKLTKNWLMRGWSDVPFALVNWTTGDCRPCNNKLAYVSKACDGETDFHSLLFLPVHLKILDKLIEQGIAEECEYGNTIAEYQRFRMASNPYLSGIHWSLTGNCNLNCLHCYMEAPGNRYSDMCEEDLQRVLLQFESANILQVSITGGEPLLRKDIFSIMKKLLEKKVRISQVYSNGMCITDEILRKIKALGISPDFCISFDGVGTHDYMRGTMETEEKVLGIIQKLRTSGYRVNVATSIDSKSKEGLLQTYRRIKELNVQSWQIAPPNRTGKWTPAATGFSQAEEAAAYAPLLSCWYNDGRPFHLQLVPCLKSF